MSLANGPALWVYFSSLYPAEVGWAAQGAACLPLSEILWLPQRIIISIILLCANLVNSKHCRSGSGPKPAVLTLAASDLPWPWTSHPPSFSAPHKSQTLVPTYRLLLRVQTFRNSLPQRTGQEASVSPLLYSLARAVGWNWASIFPLLYTCHPVPVKTGDDNCCASLITISCSGDQRGPQAPHVTFSSAMLSIGVLLYLRALQVAAGGMPAAFPLCWAASSQGAFNLVYSLPLKVGSQCVREVFPPVSDKP